MTSARFANNKLNVKKLKIKIKGGFFFFARSLTVDVEGPGFDGQGSVPAAAGPAAAGPGGTGGGRAAGLLVGAAAGVVPAHREGGGSRAPSRPRGTAIKSGRFAGS